MKVHRGISGAELARRLGKFGYIQTRQTGSHIRMTTQLGGEYHVTIPKHDPLSIGTLSSIVYDVSLHLHKTKSELLEEIFI
jgi:predicted RNA binding protein YcfA (HicA-like mRNA interferase family)